LSSYKCEKHCSNEGFFNNEGDWICWICWLEDPLNDPKGRIIESRKIKKYFIRLVDRSIFHRGLAVELYDLSRSKNKKLIFNSDFRDLSVALRKYNSLLQSIKEGRYRAPRIRFSDYYETEREYVPLEIAEAVAQEEREEEVRQSRTIRNETFVNCELSNRVFINCRLNGCYVYHSDFRNCRLMSSNIRRCNIEGNEITNSTLQYCRVHRATLRDSEIRSCSLFNSEIYASVLHASETFECTVDDHTLELSLESERESA